MASVNLMLPELEEMNALTAEKIQESRQNGHTLIPGLLTGTELEVYKGIIEPACSLKCYLLF